VLRLNPPFGEASGLVGGADADLIAGDPLADVKVTKKGEVQGVYLDQLLGYLLLARRCAAEDVTFPTVKRLGIYFARHGHLLTQEAASILPGPAFFGGATPHGRLSGAPPRPQSGQGWAPRSRR
jgi:hypothetical protein